jgi:Ser/Thr protein kinase RdoA (MazF antagonist)
VSLKAGTKLAVQAASAWWGEAEISPLGEGHIHQTFLVQVAKTGERFVLQLVNQTVFADVQQMAQQMPVLLRHLATDPDYANAFVVADALPTRLGHILHSVGDETWRAWRYIERSRVVDPFTNSQQVESAAHAFGSFQRSLTFFQPHSWRPPIPGFLELTGYIESYRRCAQANSTDAVPADLAAVIEANRDLVTALGPSRGFIHGDCKINNVLFRDDKDQALAVIDLDTVGPGHWAWDFGDLVRSVSFSHGSVDLGLFQACVKGFSCGRGMFGQPAQMTAQQMSIAPAYIGFTLGLRFLIDHLRGDEYFRVSQRGENLHRAVEQFTLLQQFNRLRAQLLECALAQLSEHVKSGQLS